ncbi:MAG: hypothetical protein LBN43_08660 [Oscillospiraceae bacterium]|jgi:ABC-type multidrug transport system fused ATPase/permease subunit|nr:hypothetical protein [Oscillospiraceae bacterium]
MEKQKKTMFESKFKAFVYTFLAYFLLIAEIGILSGFRFVFVDPAGRNGADIGLAGSTKGYTLDAIGAEIGWQFIVMSILLFIGVLVYCFWVGFKRQPFALAPVILIDLLPYLGLINLSEPNGAFTIFWGYGTSGLLPMMSLFGLHTPDDPNNRVGVIIFFAIFAVLGVIAWFAGKQYRKAYAEKYEFDLSVPLS